MKPRLIYTLRVGMITVCLWRNWVWGAQWHKHPRAVRIGRLSFYRTPDCCRDNQGVVTENLLDNPAIAATLQPPSQHYHVIGSLQGLYMPNTNDVCQDYGQAVEAIKDYREQVLDSIAQLESGQMIESAQGVVYPHIVEYEDEDGKLAAFDHEQSEYTTFEWYIIECQEPECIEVWEEETGEEWEK